MKSPLIAGKSQNHVEIISSEVRKETFNDYPKGVGSSEPK